MDFLDLFRYQLPMGEKNETKFSEDLFLESLVNALGNKAKFFLLNHKFCLHAVVSEIRDMIN